MIHNYETLKGGDFGTVPETITDVVTVETQTDAAVATNGTDGMFGYNPETGLQSEMNALLEQYQIIIVILYFPDDCKLRDYISHNYNHLDALSGEKILILSFDPPKKDIDELVDLWKTRLGEEYEDEIVKRLKNYQFNERAIYAMGDALKIYYDDMPCLIVAHSKNTKANRVRIPNVENEEDYEFFFRRVLDYAKECLELRSNDIRKKFKKLWNRRLGDLKIIIVDTNKELDFWAAELIHLEKSILQIIKPFLFLSERISKLIDNFISNTEKT